MAGKNGNTDTLPLEETQEQLDAAVTTLSVEDFADGQVVSITRQELSLLQKMLATGTEAYKEETIWRMSSFLDEDEAMDHVAAYYEAKELGMDTSFNVAYMVALCSTNRKHNFSGNLIAALTQTLQNSKFPNQQKGKQAEYGNTNPRSPLATG